MSVTVLDTQRIEPAPSRRRQVWRTVSTLVPFTALGLYGVLRWGTMLSPEPVWRLLGMLGVSLVVAALGLIPGTRRRGVAVAVGVIGLIVILPLSGLPLEWTRHVRITVTADAIGQGLSGLPNVLVPYEGINQAIRAVIVMGAGVLLLDGAIMVSFAPRSLGELRPAVAALPLIVLAIVPAVLARPHLAYLHGVLLFGLLAAMVWGERVKDLRSGGAVALIAVAAAGALIAAPAVDPHKALVNFQKLAGRLGAGNGESFDWSQTYAPLQWPRKLHEVIQVQARQKSYWKAENLDSFDGSDWVASPVEAGDPLVGVSATSRRTWTQTLQVTFTGMSSRQVIAAGVAQRPTDIEGEALPGLSDGTWVPAVILRPGDSYRIQTYTPRPTATQLAHAGRSYPGAIRYDYLSLSLPHFNGPGQGTFGMPPQSAPVTFSPLHSATPFQTTGALTTPELQHVVQKSPYGPAYALANRLAATAKTPYAYVLAVKRYLAHGFTYDERTPSTEFPLETFLFDTHRGYCQQFAGAMALLLRMGGVPARVSAGFTSGSYQSAGRDYSVSDIDAHAWVEAWFPSYGWVTFDPTPGKDPALGGAVTAPAALPALPKGTGGGAPGLPSVLKKNRLKQAKASHGGGVGGATAVRHRPLSGGTSGFVLAIVIVVLALLAGLSRWLVLARVGYRDPAAELERAFARSRRPLPPGTTLSALEYRFREDPETAAYVRAIRLQRYATGSAADALSQPRRRRAGRRALRAQLARGRGVFGPLMALFALPPLPAGRRRTAP